MIGIVAGIVITVILGVAIIFIITAINPESMVDTPASVIRELYDTADKLLDVRQRILRSNLPETERLSLADDLLYISDDMKSASGRLLAAASMHSMNNPCGGPFP